MNDLQLAAWAFCIVLANIIKDNQIKKTEVKKYINRVIDDMYIEFKD